MSHSAGNAGKKQTKMNKSSMIVCGVILLLVFMVLAVFLWFRNSGDILFIGKYGTIHILSGSMEEEIPTGSFILVEKVTADDVSVGDVITFISDDSSIRGKYNTHRVVGIVGEDEDKQFITKGDANSNEDRVNARAEAVKAKYVRVLPFLTWFAGILSKPFAFFILVLIPALILVISCVVDIIKAAEKVKREALVEAEIERIRQAGGVIPETPDPNGDGEKKDPPDSYE